MKKTLLYLIPLFALAVMADDRITTFPEGDYLGEGRYITNNGEEGTYTSFSSIRSDSWHLTHYRDDNLHFYSSYFNFDEYGFFDVELTDYSDQENPKTFTGHGYCGSVQCHLAAHFDTSVFEQTVTFLPWTNRIYWIGSMRSTEENSDFAVSWEERSVLIRSPEDLLE